ncbi:hypothetical protein [Synechocystis sp. LKSZ1]
MFNNHKLLGFNALSNQQYNRLVLEKTFAMEVQAKIGNGKSTSPAK